MKFQDRAEAGQYLAKMIKKNLSIQNELNLNDFVVIGLPRGGVPVAFEVARNLNCPLEVIVSKKLPYPGQPEYAIGAVSSDGFVVLNPNIPQDHSWREYIHQQRVRLAKDTLDLEERLYNRAGRRRLTDYKQKTVLIVDDGIATGMTAIAAAETAKARGAKAVYVTAPVICRDSFFELNEHCKGLIACEVPEVFQSVGFYYCDFQQTSESEVVDYLRLSSSYAGNNAFDPITDEFKNEKLQVL